jgi:MFS transporter
MWSYPVNERAANLAQAGPLRSLAWANGLSLTGNEGYEVTLLLLASAAYGHVLNVGWLGLVLTLPAIVVSPLVGAWLDRARAFRGTAMRMADVVRALLITSIALVLIHAPGTPSAIYLAAALITVFDVVFVTALRASLPTLLRAGADDPAAAQRLTAANSMLITQTTLAQIVAPPVFVLALQFIPPVAVVLLNAATFLASYVLLRKYAAAVALRVEREQAEEPASEYGYLAMMRDGFSAVRRDSVALALLFAYSVTAGVGFALLLSVPRLVVDRGLPALTVGLSFSVLAGGALIGGRVVKRPYFAGRPIPILVADPLVRALVVVMLAVTANPTTIVVGFFVIGVSAGLANVSRMTMIQLRFGDEAQGRMMSFYFIAHQIFTPITPVVWAATAAAFGLTAGYLMISAGFVLGSLVLVASGNLRAEARVLTGANS